MPRSLHSCLNFIDDTLEILCDDNSRELRRQAGELHARLHYGKTEEIIRFGLHEYLMDFLARVSRRSAARSAGASSCRPIELVAGSVECRLLRTVNARPMTYCVAMSLDAGMIFASDSRTNAGVDQIARFSKMKVFAKDGDRVIVTLSSGNLAVTQSALNNLDHALARRRRRAQHLERRVDVRRRPARR